MAVQAVKASENKAKGLINAGKLDTTSSWSFSAADGNKLLGDDGDNWALYGSFHLGKDTDATKETKAYYKYPYGKNGKVYASALRAIRSRSAQQEHTSIFNAAGRLYALVQEREETMEKKIIDGREVEYRHFNPSLEVREDGEGDYVFEGYIVTWNSVDSYDSTFKRGSFKKTIQERGDRIKILWNHNVDEPIGRVESLKEDSTGVLVRGQLTKGVAKAEDVYKNLKAKVIDTLSMGFITLQGAMKKGIRQITEVKLYEISPVTFEANETAVITEVRTDDLAAAAGKVAAEIIKGEAQETQEGTEKGETTSTDFDDTLMENELYRQGYLLYDSLLETLWDIWYAGDVDSVVGMADEAISKFHASYLEWVQNYVAQFWEERKTALARNELSKAFHTEVTEAVDVIAARTSLTVDELTLLSKGSLISIESRKKLVELPEAIRSAHQAERGRVVEALCNELRTGGFSDAEKRRFGALLDLRASEQTQEKESETVVRALDALHQLRINFFK